MQRAWYRTWPARLGLIVFGAFLVLVGMIGWSLEDVYGGDPDRQEYVMSEESGLVRVHDESAVVFEGTQQEADAWIEDQRGSRDYTVPILLLVAGAAACVTGVWPAKRERGIDRPAQASSARR